jgi:hypothetical protein
MIHMQLASECVKLDQSLDFLQSPKFVEWAQTINGKAPPVSIGWIPHNLETPAKELLQQCMSGIYHEIQYPCG